MESGKSSVAGKVQSNDRDEVRYEEIQTEDAEILLVAFGLSSRICQKTVDLASEKGIKVGLLRPITLYPYPYK
ncbi:MAG: hypothetical protein MZV64_51185 [Ignavibacteriales bacterium]|nr:hypothetical protein [Ignavibacteriales bacterium]